MIIVGITNRHLCADFHEQIKKINKTKLNYLVIREKDLNNKDLLELSLKVKEELKDTNIKIIVNSNIDIAKIIDADGIQLSFKDFVDKSNELYTENQINSVKVVDNLKRIGDKYKIYKMIGVSIHSYDEGVQAYKLGADYVIYGHVFQTECKKDLMPRGIEEIKQLSTNISIPIIGLGGINENNFKEVIGAGAKGIAIMSSLMESPDPKILVESLYELENIK